MHRPSCRSLILPLALIASAALFAGCDHSREDALDTARGTVDKTPPAVIAFNNRFPNVEHKCDGHGHRVFVTTRTRDPLVVIDDPSCPGAVSR